MKLRLSKTTGLQLALIAGGSLLIATIVVGTEQRTNPGEEDEITAPSPRNSLSKNEAREHNNHDLDLMALNRPTVNEIDDNLFASTVSSRPTQPAPPSPIAPPPKPAAPPLPFKFLGRLVDDGAVTIFVARATDNLSLKEGDLIDDTYRVEQIREGGIVFTYLPLNEQQVLTTGRRR